MACGKFMGRKELKHEILQGDYCVPVSSSLKPPGGPGIGISQVSSCLWKNELSTGFGKAVGFFLGCREPPALISIVSFHGLCLGKKRLLCSGFTKKSCAAFQGMSDTVTRVHLESSCESVQESEIREGCKTSSCLEEEQEHGRPIARGCLSLWMDFAVSNLLTKSFRQV